MSTTSGGHGGGGGGGGGEREREREREREKPSAPSSSTVPQVRMKKRTVNLFKELEDSPMFKQEVSISWNPGIVATNSLSLSLLYSLDQNSKTQLRFYFIFQLLKAIELEDSAEKLKERVNKFLKGAKKYR